MIHDSKHWKQPLLRTASLLSSLRFKETETTERALARVEREIFVGFYAIRKLLETFKVSSSTKELQLDIQAFHAKSGSKVDYLNTADIDKFFELKNPIQEQKDIGFLCNQIIHSYVFLISIGEDGGLEGFFVASDTMRSKKIYFVEIVQVIDAFRQVGSDYPRSITMQRNQKTDQWEV